MGQGLAAGIAALGNIITTGMNIGFTKKENRRSRAWSDQYYQRQYDDSIDFWNMQNAYNDPQAQRARLEAAGFSPALMYGQSGSTGNAGSISVPDVQRPEFRTPDLTGLASMGTDIINAIYDTEIKQAQTNNLKAMNGLNMAREALTLAQEAGVRYSTDFKKSIEQWSAEAIREGVRMQQTERKNLISQGEMATAMHAHNMQEAVGRIAIQKAQKELINAQTGKTRAERQRLGKEMQMIEKKIMSEVQSQQIRQFEIDLNRKGVTKQDSLWWRTLSRNIDMILQQIGFPNPFGIRD